ncbi:GH14401 [Drosophila grimshawi]|uniref:GH14401 n=1 Tax=Drosophila grimshawi TaxID=7222 RepID=B4J1A7_DROGR|nr:GH14401 [Drosophila grimshawi]
MLASPPHDPSIEGDVVMDAVPEADEEVLPRCRRYSSDMDDVNPEWLRWQYPELPPTPDAGRRHHHGTATEPDEAEISEGEAEGPGTLGEEEPVLISSEDEDTGEERRSSASPVNPDDVETMPWPQATPKPDVIVISDEEEDEE